MEVTALAQACAERLDELEAELSELSKQRDGLDSRIQRFADERQYLRNLVTMYGSGAPNGSVVTAAAAPVRPSASIADAVHDLLADSGRAMHYREIERELRSRGIHATGKDPANVLLASYFRDPRLYRPARGTYAIRPAGQQVRSVGTKRSTRSAS